MGAMLGRALCARGFAVAAFALVGAGSAYQNANLPLVGVQGLMPSGGFVLEGTNALWRDVQAGLLRLTWQQIKALRQMRQTCDFAVGVGDVYPLALNALFLRQPFIFIPTAKSDYIRGHYAWEAALMRRTCKMVFPRDLRTTISLANQGVPVEYQGNLMMDALNVSGERWGGLAQPVVALLPGSRAPEAYANTLLLLEATACLVADVGAQSAPLFLLALAGGLSQTRLAATARAQEWHWVAPADDESARGICGRLQHASGAAVSIVRGKFGDVLAGATLVIGMSGTGNEQAAGMGLPVVALPGVGPQFTRGFALDQQRLLGEAVLLVEAGPLAVAAAVHVLLGDAKQREWMGQAGRERMGAPGAVQRIVDRICSLMAPDM